MSTPTEDRPETPGVSEFYREFLAERDEILRHKWFESERVGYDIGFERALLDWVAHYRSTWRERRRLENSRSGS
jgi:hypothetical protein